MKNIKNYTQYNESIISRMNPERRKNDKKGPFTF